MATVDATTVKLRRDSWDAETVIEVQLVPTPYANRWQVLHEGVAIGEVSRYVGSLDRVLGRGNRWPGKRRTLWSSQGVHPEDRADHGYVSRAEAIRQLLP